MKDLSWRQLSQASILSISTNLSLGVCLTQSSAICGPYYPHLTPSLRIIEKLRHFDQLDRNLSWGFRPKVNTKLPKKIWMKNIFGFFRPTNATLHAASQNVRQRVQKWPIGSGKGFTLRFWALPSTLNFFFIRAVGKGGMGNSKKYKKILREIVVTTSSPVDCLRVHPLQHRR